MGSGLASIPTQSPRGQTPACSDHFAMDTWGSLGLRSGGVRLDLTPGPAPCCRVQDRDLGGLLSHMQQGHLGTQDEHGAGTGGGEVMGGQQHAGRPLAQSRVPGAHFPPQELLSVANTQSGPRGDLQLFPSTYPISVLLQPTSMPP